VAAPSAKVATSATAQFIVAVQNASNPSVNWQVNSVVGGSPGVGLIDATGLYTAPTSVPTPIPMVTVSAVLVADTTKSGSAAITVTAVSQNQSNVGVFSWHNDNSLSGANTQETALTQAKVSSAAFGKLFSCAVDGALYA